MSEPNGGRHHSDLPLWLRAAIIAALSLTLIGHIILDALLTNYEGQGTSLMLGGIVGTSLGFNEFLRGRRGS